MYLWEGKYVKSTANGDWVWWNCSFSGCYSNEKNKCYKYCLNKLS